MESPRFWIGVATQDHVDRAVAGSYVEVNHGRAGPLERMHADDGFAWYASRSAEARGSSLQAFTALGRIDGDAIRQADDDGERRPFRRAIVYLAAQPASVRTLVEQLGFIRSKQHWGGAFRYGFLRVPAADFAVIAAAMGRNFDEDFVVPR